MDEPIFPSLRRRYRSLAPSPRRWRPLSLPAEVWPHICHLISAEAFGITMVISVSQLSKQFIAYTAHAFIMHMPISVTALQHVVGHVPSSIRVKRIMAAAHADFCVMNLDAFKDIILIQLCLQHRSINSKLSVEGVIRILLQSLRSVYCPFHRRLQNDTLEEQFAWLQKGLHLDRKTMDVIVNPAIPFIQRNFRYNLDDSHSVNNIITLLRSFSYVLSQGMR